MRNPRTLTVVAAVAAILAIGSLTSAQGATVIMENAIWANGHLYGTVVTPTAFKNAPPHSTDVIYNFAMNQVQGQRSVSEAAPGDRDYNGGRWTVKFAMFTPAGETYFDADNDDIVDFELTSAEQVLEQRDLGRLEIVDSDISFVCPLLP